MLNRTKLSSTDLLGSSRIESGFGMRVLYCLSRKTEGGKERRERESEIESETL